MTIGETISYVCHSQLLWLPCIHMYPSFQGRICLALLPKPNLFALFGSSESLETLPSNIDGISHSLVTYKLKERLFPQCIQNLMIKRSSVRAILTPIWKREQWKVRSRDATRVNTRHLSSHHRTFLGCRMQHPHVLFPSRPFLGRYYPKPHMK